MNSAEVDLRVLCFVVSYGLQASPATHTTTKCLSLSTTAQPTIVGLPAPMSHTEGDRFELVCTFTGIPAPEIRWEKDGSLFLLEEGRRIINSTSNNDRMEHSPSDVFLFPTVSVAINVLRILSGPRRLWNGTSVDILCVNFGFPRPEIVFFRDTKMITLGQGNFTCFTQVSFDAVRLTMIQQGDGGDYVCEARIRNNVLNQSQPERLAFCSMLLLD